MQINGSSERVVAVGYIIASLFFVLVMRLWQLQILQGDEYRRLSEENRLHIVRVAAPRGIIYDRNGIPLVKNAPYYSVSINPQALARVDMLALCKLLKTDPAVISKRTKLNHSLYEPIRLKEGLSAKEIAFIESRRSDFPGLSIDVDVSRQYLFGTVGAHLIGYLGKLNESQAQAPEFKDVPPDAFIGQWGIERLYDKKLRGRAGEMVIEVDAMGRELRLIQEKPPVRGEDMRLAMDINLQKEAEDAFGDKTGALVALRPDTGEILALISKPSFDPNLFAKGINSQAWEALMTNPRLLLLDEVSLGLAPVVVDGVYRSLAKLLEGGSTIVLVEQDLRRAMGVADRVLCMLEGRIVLEGAPADLTREQVTEAYFGLRGQVASA